MKLLGELTQCRLNPPTQLIQQPRKCDEVLRLLILASLG